MTDGDALLAAIRVHPDEDVPRLAYADWLDENGQPERAAFIRVQVELARKENRTRLSPECVCDMLAIGEPCCVACQRREDEVEALKARERELLDVTNGKRWFPEFSFVACGDLSRYTGTHLLGTARRGFVESVAGPWADWVIEADEALERYPIQSVSLTTMPPYEWQLANWNPVEAARSRHQQDAGCRSGRARRSRQGEGRPQVGYDHRRHGSLHARDG